MGQQLWSSVGGLRMTACRSDRRSSRTAGSAARSATNVACSAYHVLMVACGSEWGMLFGNLLCGTTDSPLAPGLAVQLCLLHPRQYISLWISQNASCFGISGCSCTAVNRMYGHGSLTCDWPRCACQRMGQFTASAPTNQSPFGR